MVSGMDLFPETDNGPDILAGYPDFSGGRVTEYFASLPVASREVVQDYMIEGIDMSNLHSYLEELVKGYAVRDPERKFLAAQEMAQHEIDRLQTYLDIYVSSKDGFVDGDQRTVTVTDDETEETHSFQQSGWTWVEAENPEAYEWNLNEKEKFLRPIFEEARSTLLTAGSTLELIKPFKTVEPSFELHLAGPNDPKVRTDI